MPPAARDLTLRAEDRRAARARAARMPVVRPLPWPPPRWPRRQALRPHDHRCLACHAEFRCPGPDETGFCAPVCLPCYWVELGSQLRAYKQVVAALCRKRLKIQRKVGQSACTRARMRRRKLGAQDGILAGFGKVIATGENRNAFPDAEDTRGTVEGPGDSG